jgi:subtilisin
MAQDKDERPNAMGRKSGETTEDSVSSASAKRSATANAASGRPVQRDIDGAADSTVSASAPIRRREQYLIGRRSPAPNQPFTHSPDCMQEVVDYLNRQEDVEVVRRIKLGGARPFAANDDGLDEVVVARIDENKAQRLRSAAPPHLIIEPDVTLSCADYFSIPTRNAPLGMLLPLRPTATEVSVRVLGDRDQPLAGAAVVVEAGGLPAQALTDESGLARLTLLGGLLDSVQTLFIRAAANHWDRLIPHPNLGVGVNTVKLRSLSEVYPDFPREKLLGWGQRLLGLDPLAGRFSGRNVKIGIIDSGCDNTHPLLRQVTQGKDFTAGGTDTSWNQDLLSHGTHCSGIVGAAAEGPGVVGCAPAAELHVFKVLPQGRVADLLSALDECIRRELDLINISVVLPAFSQLVAQKVREARQRGIACIVAAGNNAFGPPLFPATLPDVLAVAAVGKLKEFPPDSSHVLNALPQLVGIDEVFPASFSSWGPQGGISAPGVAVISTVPGGGYMATDGTSAAAAHITGLAALVMAHHPFFQEGLWATHSEQRVQALFELIRASAIPRSFDHQHGGAGVPDLRRIPVTQSFARGVFASDGTEAVAIPSNWPIATQGWPTWLLPRAAGF